MARRNRLTPNTVAEERRRRVSKDGRIPVLRDGAEPVLAPAEGRTRGRLLRIRDWGGPGFRGLYPFRVSTVVRNGSSVSIASTESRRAFHLK